MAVISWRIMKADMWEMGALRRGAMKRRRKRGRRDSIREMRVGSGVVEGDGFGFVAYRRIGECVALLLMIPRAVHARLTMDCMLSG